MVSPETDNTVFCDISDIFGRIEATSEGRELHWSPKDIIHIYIFISKFIYYKAVMLSCS